MFRGHREMFCTLKSGTNNPSTEDYTCQRKQKLGFTALWFSRLNWLLSFDPLSDRGVGDSLPGIIWASASRDLLNVLKAFIHWYIKVQRHHLHLMSYSTLLKWIKWQLFSKRYSTVLRGLVNRISTVFFGHSTFTERRVCFADCKKCVSYKLLQACMYLYFPMQRLLGLLNVITAGILKDQVLR